MSASKGLVVAAAALLLTLLPRTGAPAGADGITGVPDAGEYTLVYSLQIPVSADFNVDGVPYEVDRSAHITAPFDRVAYYLQLGQADAETKYVWVSISTYTTRPNQDGLTVAAPESRAVYQRDESNHAQVPVTGTFVGPVTRIEARA